MIFVVLEKYKFNTVINVYVQRESMLVLGMQTDVRIKSGFKPLTRILSDYSENLITEEKQIVHHFKEYFHQLLNQPNQLRETVKLFIIIRQN